MTKRKVNRKGEESKRGARKRCSSSGCRKLRVGESIFCKAHTSAGEGEEPSDPKVTKLSEVDALRFGKADAEMRNDMQELRLIDYQAAEVRQKAKSQLMELDVRKAQLQNALKSNKVKYLALVEELAKSYGIGDPKNMVIDPDSGTVRDLTRQ